MGYPYCIFTPNETALLIHVPDICAKFHQNQFKIATVRARTVTQTSDTYPMTDDNYLRRSLRSLGGHKNIIRNREKRTHNRIPL